MTIDKQEHQALLLEIIKQTTYPGHLIDLVYEIRNAILSAKVGEDV